LVKAGVHEVLGNFGMVSPLDGIFGRSAVCDEIIGLSGHLGR
jgi:hypothetical protein